MKVISATEIKEQFPNRKSLNQVLDNARPVSIIEQIESIKTDMCQNYCKIPYQYSRGAWEQMQHSENCPCRNCPLKKL